MTFCRKRRKEEKKENKNSLVYINSKGDELHKKFKYVYIVRIFSFLVNI
jgi:hypothetical protein